MDFVNIKDFDAFGDGINDDTNSILDSIDFAKSNNIKSIYIPSGTYLVTRGFNLDDDFLVYGDGMDLSIIKLKDNLPQRANDLVAASIFMGKPTFGNGDNNDILGQEFSSHTNYNITIKDICIDLQRDSSNFDITGRSYPTYGAILIYNAENCLIDKVKILNTWYWGISIQATIDGNGCYNNTISNCIIESQEWYIEKSDSVINPRQNPPLIAIQLQSYQRGDNNGSRANKERKQGIYTPSKCVDNTIINNIIRNGSHGIQTYNASSNLIENNKIYGPSNRGIIITATSDENLIQKNEIYNIGSAGILVGYNSCENKIYQNIVKNILGVQGDGIKCSVNCNHNEILNNDVSDFDKNGITLMHGTIGNIVKFNIIDGGSKSAFKTGIKILANGYDEYFVDNLKFNDELTAEDNICESNTIKNVQTPIKLGDDVFNKPEKLKNNSIKDNIITPIVTNTPTPTPTPNPNPTTNPTTIQETNTKKYTSIIFGCIAIVVIYLLIKKK